MNKTENNLVPELRFPEFKNNGEWYNKKLGEISEIVRGGSPRPIQEYITNDKKGLNWLKIADVSVDAKYITKTQEKVKIQALKSTREVNPGDLILSNSMSFGRPYILKIKTCIHDGWIAIRNISNLTFEDYLYYFILSESSQKYFQTNAAGAAVKNLNADIIKLLPIVLPKEKKEQQKIAECLSSLDEVITSHHDKLEALKNHKKGLLQNLFPKEGENVPKFRFPEFVNDEGWKKKNLGELFEVGNGRDYKHLNKGDIPVYGSGGYMLSVNDFLYDGESVCIGRKGTIDKPIFLTGKFWTVDTLFYTYSFNNCYPKFIYYIFQNIDWLKHNEAGGIPSLSKTNIHKIKTMIPKIKEQKKIAICLSEVDDLITIQIEKIKQLKAYKKGLMQRLFPKK
ncbi:restriction endonuclease subunit S [Chryseobacterium sp.]|uniref:restriction endonuclease subunit S n=1 Tax=Chryseobacterium sp. TaxID=1871047 RepID=UPI0023F4D4DC|nr:restriction endonuclease subunit S [Chryseobacterium sp.]